MQCWIICKCTFPFKEHIVRTNCECYENGIFEHYLGNIHTFLAVGYSLMIQDCTTYLSSWFVWWVDTIVLISEQYGSEESPFVIPPHTLSSSIKGGCLLVKLIVMISDKNSFERQPNKSWLPVNKTYSVHFCVRKNVPTFTPKNWGLPLILCWFLNNMVLNSFLFKILTIGLLITETWMHQTNENYQIWLARRSQGWSGVVV